MSKSAAGTVAKAAAGRPSIQNYGVLFVLRSQVDFTIIQCSDSVLGVLGWGPSELVGQSIKNILDFSSIQRLVSASSNIDEEGRMLRLKFDVRAGALSGARTGHGSIKAEDLSFFVGSLHTVQGGLVLEVEPEVYPTFEKAGFTPALLDAAREVEAARSLKEFCRGLLQLLMRTTGFEKGIIEEYSTTSAKIIEEVIDRLGPDGREVHLTQSTPLQLPEKDMKALQAFFMKRPVHFVMDAGADPSPIVPAVNPSTMQTLDMSSAYLRSPPPALLSHLGYSGATACLSIAVLQRDKLWGVISCHSSEPRFVGREDRALLLESLDTLASMLTARLQAHEEEMAKHRTLQLERLYDGAVASREFGRTLVGDPDLSPTSMADVVPCTGCAILFAGRLSVRGATPRDEEVRELARFVAEHIAEGAGKERQGGAQGGGGGASLALAGHATMGGTTRGGGVGRHGPLPEVWYSDAVADSAYPRRAQLGDCAHGTLAVPLDPALSSFALWFRTKRTERAAGRGRGQQAASVGRGNNIAINLAALAAAAGSTGSSVAGEPWSGADLQGAKLLGAMVSQAAAVLALERIAAAPWYGVGGEFWVSDAGAPLLLEEGEEEEEEPAARPLAEGEEGEAEEEGGAGSEAGGSEAGGSGAAFSDGSVRVGLEALEDVGEALEESTLPALAVSAAQGQPPRILGANGAAALLLHRGSADVTGKALGEVVGDEANGPLFRQLDRIAAGPAELAHAHCYAAPAGPGAALLLFHDGAEGRKEAEARIKDALAAKHAAAAREAPRGEQGAALRRLLKVLELVATPFPRPADPGEFATLAALHRILPPPAPAPAAPSFDSAGAYSMRRVAAQLAPWVLHAPEGAGSPHGSSHGSHAPPAAPAPAPFPELDASVPLEELFGRPLSAAPSAGSLHPLLAGVAYGGAASLASLRPPSPGVPAAAPGGAGGAPPRPHTAEPVLQRPQTSASEGPPPGSAWGIRPLVPMRGRQRTVGLVDLRIDERVRAWGARGENDGTTDSLHKFVYGSGFYALADAAGRRRGPAGSRGNSVTVDPGAAGGGGGGGAGAAAAPTGMPSARPHGPLHSASRGPEGGAGGERPRTAGNEAAPESPGALSRAASAGQLRPQTSTSDLLGSTAALTLGRKLAGRLAAQQAAHSGLWSPGSFHSTPPAPASALGMRARQRSAPSLHGPAPPAPASAWVAQTAISGAASLEVFAGERPPRGCCDLRALICGTFLAAAAKALRRQVALRVALEGAQGRGAAGARPVWARVDPIQFRLHLHETLARALNAMHAGTVTLQVAVLEPRPVGPAGARGLPAHASGPLSAPSSRRRANGQRVQLTVALKLQDTVVGVPGAELPPIHARFDALMGFLHTHAAAAAAHDGLGSASSRPPVSSRPAGSAALEFPSPIHGAERPAGLTPKTPKFLAVS
eukprot:tig00000545_g1989.t1